ncbi:MAG: rRNA maturation RNase YbeY [Pleurocapsa sp.]
MDLTSKTALNAIVYLENLYQGDLVFEDQNSIASIPWVDWFEIWLTSLKNESAIAAVCELSLRLTGDKEIQDLNRQYRQQDRATDVLAFAATEVDVPQLLDWDEPLYLGDIIISLDTAAKQAQMQGHSLEVELAWLASHGLLHLLGWDHPDDDSLAKMLNKQANMLKSVKITESNASI